MNISSLNTSFILRQQGLVQDTVARTLRNLASGLRVNSAADDAAGLALSEKLRTQINGLDQAARNIRDGISMLQTADGALDAMTLQLQRLRTLAIEAANETLTVTERRLIQTEVDQLTDELNRMSRTVEWNTKRLLAGDETAPVSDEVVATVPQQQSFTRGDTESFTRFTRTESFTTIGTTDPVILRGASVSDVGRTISSTTAPQDHGNSSSIAVNSLALTATTPGGVDNYAPRWKSDNSPMVAFSSSRGAGLYAINAAAPGNAAAALPGDYDPAGSTTHVFGPGDSKTLFVGGLGDIYVRTNGNPASDIRLTFWGTGAANPTFSPDGLRFAYEQQVNASKRTIYTGTFDPALNAGRGGAPVWNTALNTAADTFDIDPADIVVTLPVNPEVYNINPDALPGPKAIEVYNGAVRVPYADGVFVVDGYTLQNGNEIHFTGAGLPAGADQITVNYTTDYNDAVAQNANLDGATSSILPTTPELYNLNGPGARSLRVTLDNGATWVTYDPTQTNGFDVAGNTVTLYGNSRPNAGQTVRIYWVADADGNPAQNDYEFTLANAPELYNLNGPDPASLEIRKFDGTRITYDPTHTNGYDIVGNQVTIYGDGTAADMRPDAYTGPMGGPYSPIINNYYHTDYNDANAVAADQDGVVEITLTNLPELYNLNGPDPRSIKVTNDGGLSWEPYDPTQTNGWDINPVTQVLSVYGTSRPDRLETLRLYYAMDYGVTVADNELTYQLSVQPQVYNLVLGDPLPRGLRVEVAGVPIALDAVNGFTYDAGTNRITLHGTARPDATSTGVVIYAAVDLDAANGVVDDADGNVDLNLGLNPDTTYESTEVYVANAEIAPADFDIVGANLEITGPGRPNGDQTIITQYILPVDNVIDLGGTPVDYGGGLSSEAIFLTGETDGYGVIANQRLVKGVDYSFVDADTIQLIGPARLVGLADTLGTPGNPADDTQHRITATYAVAAANTVTSVQPIEDTGFNPGESELVFVTGEMIGYGAVVNQLLTQNANPLVSDYQVVGNQLILTNNARLVGAGNRVDLTYFEQGSNTLTLATAAADYAPGMAGSELVYRDFGGPGQTLLTQGSDYTVAADGRTITLVPGAMLAGTNTFTVEYVENNEFQLAVPATMGTNGQIDETSVRVTVNGAAVAADPDNGFSVVRTIDHYDGARPVYDYQVVLNGTARLVGDNGGAHHEVVIDFDAEYHSGPPLDQFLHVGANQDQTLKIQFEEINAWTLGLGGADLTTTAGAEALIGQVDTALTRLHALRARYGAQINRLEHTHNFVRLGGETQTAAESRIRDADMAQEMIAFTKARILAQVNQAMLAQANQLRGMVLQLLQ